MSRAARRMLVGCMAALLVMMFAGVAGAQEQGAPAQTEITLGASPEYRDLALQIDQLLKQRKFDEARAICQQRYDAATDDETRAMFLRGIGEVYKVQRSPQCIDIFQQVLDKYPNSQQVSWTTLALAEAYVWKAMMMGGTQDSLATGLAILERFLKNYPDHENATRALWGRGMVFERQGNDAAALADYQKAVDLHPTQKKAELCLERVIALQQKVGRWDDAIASATRYLQLYAKGAAAAQLSIGFSYAGKGDLAKAMVEFDRVLSQHPDSRDQCAMALHQKASCLKSLGQPAAARAALEQLVRDYPDSYLAIRAKGELESDQSQ